MEYGNYNFSNNEFSIPQFSPPELSLPETSVVNPGGKPTDAETKLNQDMKKTYENYQKLFSSQLNGAPKEEIKKFQDEIAQDNKTLTTDQEAVQKELEDKTKKEAPQEAPKEEKKEESIGMKILHFFAPFTKLFT